MKTVVACSKLLLDCWDHMVQKQHEQIVLLRQMKQEMILIWTIDVRPVYKAFERMFVDSYIQDNVLQISTDYNCVTLMFVYCLKIERKLFRFEIRTNDYCSHQIEYLMELLQM